MMTRKARMAGMIVLVEFAVFVMLAIAAITLIRGFVETFWLVVDAAN